MTQPPHLEPQMPPDQPQHPDQHVQTAAVKPPGPSYEFTMVQDDIIRSLSRKMNFVAYFYIIVSALVGLAGIGFMFVNVLIGLFYLILLTPELLIGIWTLNAGKSFRLVVDTKGHDIPHLMNALSSLRKLYTLMFWILIVGVVFMVIAIIAAIVLVNSGLIPIPSESSTISSML